MRMVNQKTLLNPIDIRTMRKDMKQLRKVGVTPESQRMVATVLKAPSGGTIAELQRQGLKEKELLEKILKQSAEHRQAFQKEQAVAPIQQPVQKQQASSQGNQETLKDNLESKAKFQAPAPKRLDEGAASLPQQESLSKTPPAKVPDKVPQSTAVSEPNGRKKFMEDIEKWANE